MRFSSFTTTFGGAIHVEVEKRQNAFQRFVEDDLLGHLGENIVHRLQEYPLGRHFRCSAISLVQGYESRRIAAGRVDPAHRISFGFADGLERLSLGLGYHLVVFRLSLVDQLFLLLLGLVDFVEGRFHGVRGIDVLEDDLNDLYAVLVLVAQILELLLGLMLLAGIMTRLVSLMVASLFFSFVVVIGPAPLNRDVGLLAVTLALFVLGPGRWNLEARLVAFRFLKPERWIDQRVGTWPGGERSELALLLLRAGLAFTLVLNGLLLLRGEGAFGSTNFHTREPSMGLGLVELGLGLGLAFGRRTELGGGLVANYFSLELVLGGYGLHYRSLVLATAGLVLAWSRWQPAEHTLSEWQWVGPARSPQVQGSSALVLLGVAEL